jgi:hypothetical protein
MRKSWLVCVLLGTLAWGQGAPGTPPPGQAPVPRAAGPQGLAAAPDTSASVPPTAAVITVVGVCPPRPKPAAATGTAAKPATAGKPAPATTPAADCKTVITKEEFEKLLNGVTASPTPHMRRELASVLPKFIAMSNQAQKQGMDKTAEFTEMLKFAKMQILTTELQRKIQQEAADVPNADIESYYKNNPETFEQFNLQRLFVPRAKQIENDAKDEESKDEKLTDDQKKAKEAADKAKQDEAEQAMTKLAADLRARAAAGEDFQALQKEAFTAAGMKIESPTVKIPGVRRTGLPAAHAAVFELKPGDVSAVINDSGGHYIYKLESKNEIPLEQAKQEIRNTLVNQRTRDMMEKVNNSYNVVPNEAYFGPGPLTAQPQQRLPNRRPMGVPGNTGAQPQTPPASQPPAQAPDAKPN